MGADVEAGLIKAVNYLVPLVLSQAACVCGSVRIGEDEASRSCIQSCPRQCGPCYR